MRVFPLLAAPLAVLLIACGASTSGNSSSAGAAAGGTVQATAPATVKAGETLTLTESVFGSSTKVSITLSNVRAGVKPSNQFDKPQKGQYIVADVAVVVNEGKFSISSGSFKLVAADGTAYNTTFMTGVNDLERAGPHTRPEVLGVRGVRRHEGRREGCEGGADKPPRRRRRRLLDDLRGQSSRSSFFFFSSSFSRWVASSRARTAARIRTWFSLSAIFTA